jgi:hypothetical protein
VWHTVASTVTAQFPLKLAALFFACVLWLAVSAEEPTEEWVDVHVALEADSNVVVLDSLPHVQALVVGRGRDLLKLYTTMPVLRRVLRTDSGNRALIELRPGDVDLPSNVDARVRDVRPGSFTLHVRVLETRRLPVRAAFGVSVDRGYHLTGPPRLTPDSVSVRGPSTVVRALTSISTTHQMLMAHDTASAFTVSVDTASLGASVVPMQVRVHVSAARDSVPATAGDSARRAPPRP